MITKNDKKFSNTLTDNRCVSQLLLQYYCITSPLKTHWLLTTASILTQVCCLADLDCTELGDSASSGSKFAGLGSRMQFGYRSVPSVLITLRPVITQGWLSW